MATRVALTGPSSPADDLRTLLGTVTVLDVRWQLGREDGHEQHLAGHVPGAAYVDLAVDLADPPGARGRHPLPDPARFESAMQRCGVDRARPVVVYDDWAGLAATRAWWLLRHHGHPDVRVLDGGWSWWLRSGGEVEQGDVAPPRGDFRAGPGVLAVLDADGAARVAATGDLVDARAPERFRGETEPVDPVAGHIPGATNVPASAHLEDGRFRRTEDLAEAYAGLRGDGPLAAYCGSGVTATHTVFALHELGREAALYPGSWSEWIGDRSRPVATGPEDVQDT